MTTHRPRFSMTYYVVIILVMIGGFYVIEHVWDASEYFAYVANNYDGSENFTVERLDVVNSSSAVCRILLCSLALLGLVVPADAEFHWHRLVLWSAVAFALWLGMTILWSNDPGHSAYKLTVYYVFLLTAFGLARALPASALIGVFVIAGMAFVALGLFAELQLGTFHPRDKDYRFAGTVHPNSLAVYGAIMALAATVMIRREQSWSLTATAFALFGIGVVVMLITKSRTTLAAFVVGAVAIQGLRARGINRVMLVFAGLTCLAIGTLAVSFAGQVAQNKLGGAAAMGRSEAMTTLTGRLPLWEELMRNVEQRSLVGHGYLAFWDADQVDRLADMFQWEIPNGHSIYIDVLLDAGIVGLVLFLLFIFISWVSSARMYTVTQDVGFAFLFGYIAFALVHGIGESYFKLPSFSNLLLHALIFRIVWEPDRREGDFVQSEDKLESVETNPNKVTGFA